VLDHATCYRALAARDRRFDGKFFTGVTSTGVYCRPVCPAVTPKAENCTFFPCAAAAEAAGFRPCLRCRPETAPGMPAWRGTSATVSRGMQLIEEGALDEGSVEELAERLGVGGRHLRRLFVEHLGASPLSIAQTRRVHFAKSLVVDTRLPMTQIAFAAGYRNVRRFNAEVQRVFHRSPRALRAVNGEARSVAATPTIALRQAFRGPLDWEALLAFLEPRAIPGVESVSDGVYRRTVSEGDFTGIVEVSKPSTHARDVLRVSVPVAGTRYLAQLSTRARSLFDLGADPAVIAAQLSSDRRLRPLIRRHPGLRVPGAWNRFETAVRAILGQQISVAGATRLAGKLVRSFGRPIDPARDGEMSRATERASTGPGLTHLFPRPEDLADANLARIGMPKTRAATIRALARAVCDGSPLLETTASLETALERLEEIPGCGDWTAQYIAMRVLREPDAFPAGDLGLRKALANDAATATAAAVRKRAEAWRPWRAYAAMWLWSSLG